MVHLYTYIIFQGGNHQKWCVWLFKCYVILNTQIDRSWICCATDLHKLKASCFSEQIPVVLTFYRQHWPSCFSLGVYFGVVHIQFSRCCSLVGDWQKSQLFFRMNPSAEKRRHPQEDAAVHTEGSKLHRGRGLPIRAFSLFWLTECVHVSTWLFSWMRRVPRCQELFNVSHFISKGRSSDIETMHTEWNVQSVYVYCVCVIYYSHSCVFFLRDQRHLTAQYSCSSIHPTASSSHIPLTLLLLSPPLCLFPSFSLTFPSSFTRACRLCISSPRHPPFL